MGVLNKRNAVLGWAVWQIGKRAAATKAKRAVTVDDSRRPGKSAIAAGLATIGGALWFWRRRSGDSEPS
jgi:hypothetical protein